MKRFIAFILTIVVLLINVSGAMAKYTDIPDPKTAQIADMLCALGIFAPAERFNPSSNLDRASFCVLAVKLVQPGTDPKAYANYTRYPDVRSTHWGIGWINAAHTLNLMSGYSNGSFGPNDTIDYRQVITVLIKALGYTDKDVGSNWPYSYLNRAAAIGLTKGVTFGADGTEPVTRASVAELIYNMLFLIPKDSTEPFITSLGIVDKEVLLLGTDITMDDGVTKGVLTDSGVFASAANIDPALSGTRCRLQLGRDNEIITCTPVIQNSLEAAVVSNTDKAIDFGNGKTAALQPSCSIYTLNYSQVYTYEQLWPDIRQGELIKIYYKTDGSIDYIFRKSPPTLGITETELIILNTEALMPGTLTKFVLTSSGNYNAPLDSGYNGRRGNIRYDTNYNIISFTPLEQVSVRINTASSSNISLTDASGDVYTLPATAEVYNPGDAVPTTYDKIWMDIKKGEQIIVYYKPNGAIDYIYRPITTNELGKTAVVPSVLTQNPVTNAFGNDAGSALIYKNGAKIEESGLRPWDVMTYYPLGNVIFVSDLKVPGVYQSGAPNIEHPSSIMLQNKEFSMLPEAQETNTGITTGQMVTLLINHDGFIASMVPYEDLPISSVGLVKEQNDAEAAIVFPNGFELNVILTNRQTLFTGRLVTLSPRSDGTTALATVTYAPGDVVDLSEMKMGEADISAYCVFYDTVGSNGLLEQISLSDIHLTYIPSERLIHAKRDEAGDIITLVFDNISYNAYSYGSIIYDYKHENIDGFTVLSHSLTVGETKYLTQTLENPPESNTIGGISAKIGSTGRIELNNYVICSKFTNIPRSSFDSDKSVLIDGVKIPIEPGLRVYVESTGQTMSIEQARAYSAFFEVYTDPNRYMVRYIKID